MTTNIVGENIGAKMKHNAIVALLDEYAGCYRVVDSCRQEEKYGKPCLTCLADINRMQEIEKELETSIRKEVVEQVETFINKNEGWDSDPAWETMVVSSKELRTLLQGITLK